MAYNPYGYGPTPDEELKLAQAKKIEADAIAQGQKNFERGGEKIGVSPPGPMNDPFKPILPQQTAQTRKTNAEAAQIEGSERRDRDALGYKNGGPVIKASYKGTGPVDIGSWTAPTRSRGTR